MTELLAQYLAFSYSVTLIEVHFRAQIIKLCCETQHIERRLVKEKAIEDRNLIKQKKNAENVEKMQQIELKRAEAIKKRQKKQTRLD